MLTAGLLSGSVIAQTQVTFTITECRFPLGMIVGHVSQEIDLSNDTIARQILEQALKFAKEKCRVEYYRICLRKSIDKCDPWGRGGSVWAEYDNKKLIWSKYENLALKKRLEEEAMASGTIRPLPGNKFLFYLGIDSETGVKFWNITRSRSNKCEADLTSGNAYLYGEVPNTVSLLNDKIVRSLFIAGSNTFLDNCKEFVERRRETNARIYITLIPEDYKAQYQDGEVKFNPRLAWARIFFHAKNGALNIEEITNFVSIAEQDKIKKEQQEKERKEVTARFNEFVAKYGVKEWPSSQALYANPFVYEGKTIAIFANFSQMVSPTQGYFLGADSKSGDFDLIVVSDIPKGLFTSKTLVILACRVLGKTEVKVPLFGGTASAPHLKFVGVYICKDWGCKDILPTKKK
jgi:hypothetical protein